MPQSAPIRVKGAAISAQNTTTTTDGRILKKTFAIERDAHGRRTKQLTTTDGIVDTKIYAYDTEGRLATITSTTPSTRPQDPHVTAIDNRSGAGGTSGQRIRYDCPRRPV